MKVIFENSQGIERGIGKDDTYEGCIEIINAFLDEHNYKSYYKRVWENDKGICVDAGSHAEFFYIRQENNNEN